MMNLLFLFVWIAIMLVIIRKDSLLRLDRWLEFFRQSLMLKKTLSLYYSIGDLYLITNIFDILCLMKIMEKTVVKILFEWFSFSYHMDFCKFRDKHCQRVSLKIYRSIKRCVMIFRDFLIAPFSFSHQVQNMWQIVFGFTKI